MTGRRTCRPPCGPRAATVRAVSSIYRTPPWGGVAQDDFYNIVVIAEDDGVDDPERLVGRCQELEQAADRQRDVRWGPRTLDADVITVDVHGHPVDQRRPEADPAASAGCRAGIRAAAVGGDRPDRRIAGRRADRRSAGRAGHHRDQQGRACALTSAPGMHPDRRPIGDRMGFTRTRDLLVVVAVLLVLAYIVVRLNYRRMPPLPRFAGFAAAVLGIGEAVVGFGLRSRIRPRERVRPAAPTRKPVPPLTAARAVMAAKATSLAGAAVAGLWVGLLLYVLPSWSIGGGSSVRRHHRRHRAGRCGDHGRRRVVSGALLPGTECRSLSHLVTATAR